MDKMTNVATPGGASTPFSTVTDRLSTSKGHGAEFFAVASGVQIPYVGRDETGVNASSPLLSDEFPSRLKHNSLAPLIPPLQHKQLPRDEPSAKLVDLFSQYKPLGDKSAKNISRSYLKKVSTGLAFNEEVLKDRAAHTLPYNEDDLHTVFRSEGICHAKTQAVGLGGRHDPRGVVKRHALCHLKGPRTLKPVRKRAKTMPARADTRKLIPVSKVKGMHSCTDVTLSNSSERHKWDEYALACLSQSTAEWIISEQSSGSDRERLSSFLERRMQASKEETTATRLSGVVAEEKTSAKKNVKETKNKESRQALEIQYSSSFALSPAVGDKKLETDNIFQQELLGGAQPVPSKEFLESSYIVLDTNDKLKFQRQLQENYPQGSEVWYSMKRVSSNNAKVKAQKKPNKLVKGLQRWKELPVVVQDENYVPVVKESDVDIEAFSNAYKEKKKMRNDSNVVKIVEEWRSKWFLERHWQKCETEELISAMNDIHDHVRLAAVSACSKASELRHAKKEEHHLQWISLDKAKGPSAPPEAHLEPELIAAITKLLDDRNCQVRVAAAITLYSLKKPNDNAKSILLWAMEHGGPPEKWAATQCLALSGVITDSIIVELVTQLHADNAVRTEKAGALLAQLSQQSHVVQSLIAELLNSNSWKDRLTACKVIPKLNGGPNKDMTHKLSHMMWNDWNKDVRAAAAQALGRTGNGKLVHDALRERMLTGNDRIKVDALKKLSNLGIMTARLLPALQECLKSEYVSVRIEAAMAAGKLKITDKGVLSSLLRLASDDNSWKVKAHTIKALGSIGVVDERLIEVLLWSIRYEKVAAVRAEACNAVAVLGLRDERLLNVLQDRLVVETEDLAKREAIATLESLGVEPTGDLEMVEAIRQEVRRLCRRDAIVAHILQEDQAAEYTSDYKRLLTTETEQVPPSRVHSRTPKTGSRAASRATSASSRGFDPILAGYHARERMSRAPTPGELVMKRSFLPLDLNSTSSENSERVNTDKWDDLSVSSDDDEGSGNEIDHEAAGRKMENQGDSDVQKQLEKKREPALRVSLSSPRKVESSDSDSEKNDDHNSQSLFDVESHKDEPELVKLVDEIGERNISSPGLSDGEQSDESAINLRPPDVAPSKYKGS